MSIATRQKARPKTVLVSGGSRGIGRAVCLEFGRAGWHVGVHYRERKGEAERTTALIAGVGGVASLYQADVRDAGQIDVMMVNMAATSGSIGVMICNAGISSGQLLLRVTTDAWNETLATNLTGTFHCLRAAGRQMLSQGHGSILVVGSYAGLHGDVGQSAYAASKAGLLGLVKTAALEWGPHNIRVNAVLPGWHKTELSGAAMPCHADLTDHILRRTPSLESTARSIYDLATAQDISGQIWNLDSRPS